MAIWNLSSNNEFQSPNFNTKEKKLKIINKIRMYIPTILMIALLNTLIQADNHYTLFNIPRHIAIYIVGMLLAVELIFMGLNFKNRKVDDQEKSIDESGIK